MALDTPSYHENAEIEVPKDPKELLIKHPDISLNVDKETGEVNGLLVPGNIGTMVEMILDEQDSEKRIKKGEELIDACVSAGIVEPSVWGEKLDYPQNGHEDGFSFKWVNHYPNEKGDEHKFVLRYQGWSEVSQNLHVLTKEIPELKEYAEKIIEERENQ